MAILVGIDGTGSAMMPGKKRNEEYDKVFSNSFVRRIYLGAGRHANYQRGPVMLGGGLVEAVNSGFKFIMDKRKGGVTDDVLLTGYSRGAAGVVALAKKLKTADVRVRAMLLFDCVDRHLVIDAEVIPSNVGYVHHVVRHPDSGSRWSFGNDAMAYYPPTVYPCAYQFMCTHGGMGGQPWKPGKGQKPSDYVHEGGIDGKTNITFEQDAEVSQEVWEFCQRFMGTHGFIC